MTAEGLCLQRVYDYKGRFLITREGLPLQGKVRDHNRRLVITIEFRGCNGRFVITTEGL